MLALPGYDQQIKYDPGNNRIDVKRQRHCLLHFALDIKNYRENEILCVVLDDRRIEKTQYWLTFYEKGKFTCQ